jgi:hypothetical protein
LQASLGADPAAVARRVTFFDVPTREQLPEGAALGIRWLDPSGQLQALPGREVYDAATASVSVQVNTPARSHTTQRETGWRSARLAELWSRPSSHTTCVRNPSSHTAYADANWTGGGRCMRTACTVCIWRAPHPTRQPPLPALPLRCPLSCPPCRPQPPSVYSSLTAAAAAAKVSA